MTDRKLGEVKAWVQTQVSPNRFRHISGVVQAAKRIARREGLSLEDAELAAWLHDCAKELPKDRMRGLIRGTEFKLDAQEKEMPVLWHPHAGAALARKRWGIRKPAVLEAIRRHTLGAPGMGPLAQVIFVADFIETGRDFPGVREARRAAAKGLGEGVLAKASRTIAFLLQRERVLHPRLLETWNYYLRKVER